MADLETTHRVVEKLEVAGDKAAAAAYRALAEASAVAARGMGRSAHEARGIESVLQHLEEAAGGASEKLEAVGGKSQKGVKGFLDGLTMANLKARLVEKALGYVRDKIREIVRDAWEANRAFEAAGSRVQGLVLATSKLPGNQQEKVARSARVAGAVLAEFRDIALETATPLERIEQIYARVEAPLAAMGKSQKEVLDFTRSAAAAAKVYGANAEQAGERAAKAVLKGQVEGDDPFAQALAIEAAIKKTDKLEERGRKVLGALQRMGAPIAAVSRDTAGALDRWRVLTDDILVRATKPVYDKIGEVVGAIVDYTDRHSDAIARVTDDLGDMLGAVWAVGKGVWDVWAGIFEVAESLGAWSERIEAVWAKLKLLASVVELIGLGFQGAAEAVQTLADPDRGLEKIYALSEAIRLKWLEVARGIADVAQKVASVAIPEWVQKRVPFAAGFIDRLKGVTNKLDARIASEAPRVREMEKRAGLGGQTNATRDLARKEAGIGLTPQERAKLLGSIFGTKRPLIEIREVNIQQDFRDQDPDAVAIQMVRDFEKLAEAATQSTVGGAATQFGVGGAF